MLGKRPKSEDQPGTYLIIIESLEVLLSQVFDVHFPPTFVSGVTLILNSNSSCLQKIFLGKSIKFADTRLNSLARDLFVYSKQKSRFKGCHCSCRKFLYGNYRKNPEFNQKLWFLPQFFALLHEKTFFRRNNSASNELRYPNGNSMQNSMEFEIHSLQGPLYRYTFDRCILSDLYVRNLPNFASSPEFNKIKSLLSPYLSWNYKQRVSNMSEILNTLVDMGFPKEKA